MCTLDTYRRELRRDGVTVRLSRRAFEALQILVASYSGAISRDELYAALSPDTFVNLTKLNNLIAEIRSAVGDREKKIVITKHRFCYAIGVSVVQEREGASRSRCTLAIAGETGVLHE